MSDTEKILEAISQGPLPLHVLRRKTGLNHGLEVALQPMEASGQIVKRGGMVALPVPTYVDTIHQLQDEDEAIIEGDDHTEGWHDPTERWQKDEDGRLISDPLPLPDEDVTRVMAPIEPVDPEVAQTYLVATEWQEINAVDAQAASEIVLKDQGSAALVMLADEGIVFERALVTRRRT